MGVHNIIGETYDKQVADRYLKIFEVKIYRQV